MRTNISKLETLYDMRSHKAEKIVKLFDAYLSYGYTEVIIKRAKEKNVEVTASKVRKVRSFFEKDLFILNLLLELSQQNQKEEQNQAQKLDTLLKQ